MATTDEQQAPVGAITFRILGPISNEIRLTDSKVSFGADENCTVQVESDGVEAVHCLVVRKPEKSVIRSWAANSWLNGEPFEDETLKPGDTFRMADVEVQVVSDVRGDEETAATPNSQADFTNTVQDVVGAVHQGVDSLPIQAPADAEPVPSAADRETFDFDSVFDNAFPSSSANTIPEEDTISSDVADESAAAKAAWGSSGVTGWETTSPAQPKQDKLATVAAISAAAAPPTSSDEDPFEALKRDLLAAAEGSGIAMDEGGDELPTVEESFDKFAEFEQTVPEPATPPAPTTPAEPRATDDSVEVAAILAIKSHDVYDIADEPAAPPAPTTPAEPWSTDDSADVASILANLSQDVDEIADDLAAPPVPTTPAEPWSTDDSADVAAILANLSQDVDEIADEPATPPPPPVPAEPTAADGSVDVAAVLANLSDDADDITHQSAEMPTADRPPVQPLAPEPEIAEPDDSIEDYMEQLLQRVGSDAPAADANDSAPMTIMAKKQPTSWAAASRGTAANEDAQESNRPKASRSHMVTDISALRELANQSTRTAITSHARSKRKSTTMMRLLSAVAVFLLSAILLTLSRFEDLAPMLAGFVLLGLAFYLFMQAIKAGVFTSVKFKGSAASSRQSRASRSATKGRKRR